jgi:hypothetical protein
MRKDTKSDNFQFILEHLGNIDALNHFYRLIKKTINNLTRVNWLNFNQNQKYTLNAKIPPNISMEDLDTNIDAFF